MNLIHYFRQHEPQVFRYWDALTADQQNQLENQLQRIDLSILDKQKQLIKAPYKGFSGSYEPFEDFAFSGNAANRSIGEKLIKKGQAGCLLLAGGQGTRLGHRGPKGTYPISVVQNKSLFQLCAEKVQAASRWADHPLQLAIMTSSDNDEETRAFFHQHRFFGLGPDQVSFFVQESLPFLDAKGKLFLQTPWQIAEGANGNGNSLLKFSQSGLLKKWVDLGIETITIIPIDNPLADPFDAELIGYHAQQNVEVALKCTEKLHPEEKVGVLVKQEGHCAVIEYSEMKESEKNDRKKNGKLKHCCANLGLFCLSLSFIQKIVRENASLPLHKAWKSAQFIDNQDVSKTSSKPIAWKFETFIFDWLAYTKKVAALIAPREECFAPLKNFSGSDSPETVRHALLQRDRTILQKLTGRPAPETAFELPAEFYYKP